MLVAIADSGVPAADSAGAFEGGWNWGLIVSVGFSILFWGFVILGLTRII